MKKPSDSKVTANDSSQDKPDRLIQQQKSTPAVPVDYDPSSLSSARANWYFGKWDELAAIKLDTYLDHPDRGKFALLKAAAHQQLGQFDKAKKYVSLARQWQCDQRLTAHVLVAGVHNTLAKAYALKGKNEKARQHFEAAISIGESNSDRRLANQARTVQELTKLGLFPQASEILNESLQSLKDLKERPSRQQAQINILNTGIELINHELSLAHQKNQLYLGAENSSMDTNDGVDLERLEQLSPSQLGQDLWVLEKTDYKHGGFFVEFGATDGVLLSNTYLLERKFGWTGICAEPNPNFYAKLQTNRSCIVSDACISDSTGDEIEFILAGEYGGIGELASQGLHKDKIKNFKNAGKSIRLETVSLEDFLIQHNAPKTIDYLSVDTEGSEYIILEKFPFDEWEIKLITVEHNFEAQRDKIKTLLERFGYSRKEADWDDWYYR